MTQPNILTVPFAESATPQTIQEIPISRDPSDPIQKASWSAGFPSATMQPLATGGVPPMGQDFNGVLKALSEHIVYQNRGGVYRWSADVVASGGYDKGSVVQADDGLRAYVSVVDNNTDNFNANPSAIGTSWLPWSGDAAQKSANLSDLANASAARSNLGLGTAATRNAQTSPTDTTAWALMAVGAFGLGRNLDLRNTVLETGTPADVLRRGAVSGFARGGPDGLNIPAITGNNVYGVLTVYGHWYDTSARAGSASREFLTGTGRKFLQTQTGGSWDPWCEVYTTGNPPPSIGVGQTWQNVTASRAVGTTYTNTTGRTIVVTISANINNIETFKIDGVVFMHLHDGSGNGLPMTFIIPPGSTYILSGVTVMHVWAELR